MLQNEFLESLPADPEEAFSKLEQELRERIPHAESFHERDEQWAHDQLVERARKDYIVQLAAFADVFNVDIGVNFQELMVLERDGFEKAFEIASHKVRYYSSTCAFRTAQRRKQGTTCIYVLDSGAKLRIRKHIEELKVIIEDADLTDLKKEALFRKLSSFSLEVDKDRTNLEALASLYVQVKPELKTLGGAAESIDKIWSSVSKGGQELYKVIAQKKPRGFLEGPMQNSVIPAKQDFSLDDEIPF